MRFYKEYKDEFEQVPLSVAQFRSSKYATDSCTNISCIHKNIQGYVKKVAKSLHIVYNMSKKVRNFDMLGDTNKGVV